MFAPRFADVNDLRIVFVFRVLGFRVVDYDYRFSLGFLFWFWVRLRLSVRTFFGLVAVGVAQHV